MSFATALARLERLENPYPGLRPFEKAQAHLFFGRDLQVVELVERLDRKRLVAVVGVSGSGKSSIVRAGLIPALERTGLPRRRGRWRTVITRPAGAPFESLAGSLGVDAAQLRKSSHGLIECANTLGDGESLLVVVDQFEELFRYKDQGAATEEDRRRQEAMGEDAAEFVQMLLATHRHSAPIYIVLTMRSDYLGECAEFRDLPETLNDCQYLVPRMTREERRQAIEAPLGRVRMAPSLVQRVLNDAGDEPDQLPVLQHALMRTWSYWRAADPMEERPIEIEDYEAVGGFEGALNRHAEELLRAPAARVLAPEAAGLNEGFQIAAFTDIVFRRLTARGRNNRERRDPAQLAELYGLCAAETVELRAQVRAVIDLFRGGEASFLVPREGALTDETYIDIAHESLIRQWRTLGRGWVPWEAGLARTFHRLIERERGEPLSGLDLVDATTWDHARNKTAAWAKHYADEASLVSVLEFIGKSRALRDKRERARKRGLWLAVLASLFFALLAAFSALEWSRARGARERLEDALETSNQATLAAYRSERTARFAADLEKLAEDAAKAAATEANDERESEKAKSKSLEVALRNVKAEKAGRALAESRQQVAEEHSRQEELEIERLGKLENSKMTDGQMESSASRGLPEPPPPLSTTTDAGSHGGCAALVRTNFRAENFTLLSENEIESEAHEVQLEVPVLLAVLSVEGSSVGFLQDGRPIILFERQFFSRNTGGRYDGSQPNLSNPTPGGYGSSGASQYDRLTAAAALDCTAALEATSWGIAQVSGSSYRLAGYSIVDRFVESQIASEAEQLHALIHLLQARGLVRPLQNKDWAAFARDYNGPAFAVNRYDIRLQKAYLDSLNSPPDFTLRAAQFELGRLGIYGGPADGRTGLLTVNAIKSFQANHGLNADGVLGVRTKNLLVGSRLK